MKKPLLTLSFLLSVLYSWSQNCPANLDFENDSKINWTCKVGTYGRNAQKKTVFTLPNTNDCKNANGDNAPITVTEPGGSANSVNRHVITSGTGTDPNSNGAVPVVAPGGGKYSFRLGDASGGGNGANLAKAEAISYTFKVTQQNAGLTYMYAAFLTESLTPKTGNTGGPHSKSESTRFQVSITDEKGVEIPCGQYLVIEGVNSSNFKKGKSYNNDNSTVPLGQWIYCDWTTVALDLTAYINTNVTIEFRVADCYPINGINTSCSGSTCTYDTTFTTGSHSAYAYIDLICKPVEVMAPVICANPASIQMCAPDGYKTYSWPSGQPGITTTQTTKCVTINNPIPGTTYTVNLTTLTGCQSSGTVTLKGFDFTVKDTAVCPNASPFKLDLKPSLTGTFNYSWSPATGLSCTTCEDPTVTPTSTRTYTVTMSDPSLNGCTRTKTVTVTVNSNPTITVNSATICKGAKANLNATGATTYTWSPATGLNSTTGSTVSAGPPADQTYIVKGANASGCTNTAQVSIKVNNCMAVFTNDTTICEGRCAILNAVASSGTGPYTYTWSNGGSNLSTVCPTTTTSYTVLASDANGNTASDVMVVNIQNIPTPSVAPVSVCSGLCAALSATGANTYSWKPSTGLNTTTGSSVNACNLTADQTYTVTGSTSFGCTNTTTVIVTINALPTLTSSPASICNGSSTTLSVSGAVTYTWSPTTGLSSVLGSSVDADPIVTTQYTIRGTDSKGCTGSTNVTVTVNPMPDVNGSDITICKGSPSPLTASGADTYTWSPAIGLSATTGATVNASPPSDQSYVIMASTNAGCTGSATASVKVNNCMIVKANDTTICASQCAILRATASVGVPGYTYSWSGGNTHLGTVCPLTTTDYTVTATDVNGNTASDILTVTIQNTPTLVAAPVATCIGTCTTLTVSGATTYSWSPTTGLNSPTGNSVTACNLTADQTYLITGSTTAGCTNTLNVTVTINPLPTLSTSPAIVCKGNPATLTVGGANTYSWTPAAGLNTTTGGSVIAKPSISTVYTITGKDQNGCTNTITTNVLVNLLPIISGNSPSICINSSATLTVTGADSYTWSPALTLSSSIGSSVIATPTSSTNYLVLGIDNNGCTGSTMIRVAVDPIPVLTINSATICRGNSTSLTVGGAFTYVWSPPTSITPSTGNTVLATPSVTTTYSVLATSNAGCTQTTQTTVVVNIPPNIRATGDTICALSTGTLTATGGVKYTWEPGTLLGTPLNVSPSTTTTYTVVGEDANGCTNTTTALIKVKPLPVADFVPDPQTVSIEAPTINFYNTTVNGKIYKWDFGDGSKDSVFHTKHVYEEPGKYYVCLNVENNGCYSTICKDIVITPEWTFYVPNAFSPNGDGLNDLFIGVGTNILEYEMWIFDRWGKMIYHCMQMDKPWNGRVENDLSNEVAQEDVYVWKFKIKDVFEKKHVYVGHVTIVK